MFSSFITIGEQVLILFLLIGVGFVLGKLRLMDDRFSRTLSNVTLLLVVPCITIVSFQRPLDQESLSQFSTVLLISIALHAINAALAFCCMRKKDAFRPILQFGVIFSNCAFMAYPLQQALLGSIGVFYGSAYVAVFNILMWSYGVYLMTGDRSRLKLRPMLLTPNILGVLIGLVLYLLQITLPPIIFKPMEFIASLATPLPMLVIGYQLYRTDLRRVLKSVNTWLSLVMRLVVMPLLMLGICLLLGTDKAVTIALVVASSAPAAAMLSMFATYFDKNTELSSSLVSAHTLFAAITMPLVVGLAQFLA